MYGKSFKENRNYQQPCIQIYRDHYHRFFLPGIFLAGWICLDDELYVGISGRDHVWNGTYNTDGRLPGYFSRPKEVVIGAVAQYTIMPVIAWLLCKVMNLPADLALGVILVGCCPGGTASNVITYIAGGDVALSVGMTIVSTLAAPLMTPFLVYVLAGAWVEVSFWAMVLSVVKVILVPVLLGVFLRSLAGEHVDKVSDVMPLVSVVAIVMIIGGIVAVNAEKIVSCGVLVLGVVAIHNFCGMMLGLLAAKIFHVEYARTTAIAIEVGMQNSGLAVSLAAANFAANPLATLPGAIFSVWHNIAGSIFAGIRRAGAENLAEIDRIREIDCCNCEKQ